MDTLNIATWNVLNKGYENPEYYGESSLPFLKWENGRRERAFTYLQKFALDVTCLQEVSQSMLHELLNDETYREYYDFVWSERTRTGNKTEDGEVILFQKQRLTLVRQFTWRFKSGDHIFLACLFEKKQSPQKSQFWCINTHVNWSTRETDLQDLER